MSRSSLLVALNCALRNDRVDYARHIVEVTHVELAIMSDAPQCVTVRRGAGAPKSHKERDVPIPAQLVGPLTEAMAGRQRGDLVFTGPRGGRLNPSNVCRAIDWKSLRTQLRREDLRIHDLRHTLATLLFDAGAAANDVQAVLGHSTMQMTERHSRARADSAKRAANAIDSLFQ